MARIFQEAPYKLLFGRDDRRAYAELAITLCSLLMSATVAQAAANDVSVANGWLRFIIPNRPAAGYFDLDNSTDAAIKLVGASSPGCGQLMLHQSRNVNGVETMAPVQSVDVPAHRSVSFTPGGYHLMCMSPTARLSPGSSVPITLKFANGSTITADFAVRGADTK
jgi:periplasmic copper chaperone A